MAGHIATPRRAAQGAIPLEKHTAACRRYAEVEVGAREEFHIDQGREGGVPEIRRGAINPKMPVRSARQRCAQGIVLEEVGVEGLHDRASNPDTAALIHHPAADHPGTESGPDPTPDPGGQAGAPTVVEDVLLLLPSRRRIVFFVSASPGIPMLGCSKISPREESPRPL